MEQSIYSGWLTKSPGSRYVSILKGKVQLPVKAKWRKRYFRLYNRGGTYTTLKMSYYQDETLNKKLGSIKLEDCVKIQSSLDSSCYQYLFALQTSDTRNRVYYLAADSEKDMNTWVAHLCEQCKLKVDTHEINITESLFGELPANTQISPKTGSTSQQSATSSIKPSSSFSTDYPVSGEDYDFPPVPHPVSGDANSHAARSHPQNNTISSKKDSYTEDYDIPPTPNPVRTNESYAEDYDVPPTPNPVSKEKPYAEDYDVPFTPVSKQPSSDDEDPNDIYENSTAFLPPNNIEPSSSQSTSDVPAGNSEIIVDEVQPQRPPKPAALEEQAMYGNLVSTSCVSDAAPVTNNNLDEIYDIPRSLSTAPPLMCTGGNTRIHKYINASTKSISIEDQQTLEPDPSDQPTKPPRDLGAATPSGDWTGGGASCEVEYDLPSMSRPLQQGKSCRGQASPSAEEPSEAMSVMRISASSHIKSYVRLSGDDEEVACNASDSTSKPADSQSYASSSEDEDSESDLIYDVPTPLTQLSPQGTGRPQPAPRSVPTAAPRSVHHKPSLS